MSACPFKYNSFPVYAGEQIYHLTSRLASNLEKLNSDQRENFPPVLAFQSVVDATIPPRSIVDGLLDRTANTGAQLVLFDVNRAPDVSSLLVNTGADFLDSLESRPSLPFDLSLVGSASGDPQKISVKHRKRGEDSWRETLTELRWPGPVFSLSHIALPFAPDDPIYGRDRGDGLLRLGDLWLKGERGVFGVPLGLLARQRYNPFHHYQQQRIIEALERVRENQSSTP